MIKLVKLIIVILFLFSCGGNGGGGSIKVEYISTNGFSATDDNIIEAGQKRFAFGQTANFKALELKEAQWSCMHGDINSDGQYLTPESLDGITSDTVSLQVNGKTYSRNIDLIVSPEIKSNYFLYNDGNQRYAFEGLGNSKAVGLGVFQNGVESQVDILVKDQVLSNKKELANLQNKPRVKPKNQFNCGTSKKNNKAKKQRKNISNQKSKKQNRVADPVGTRESFYSGFDEDIILRDFEKIYSGTKCLIYSQIDTTTSLPYVGTSSINVFANIFENENPYHPEKKSIFQTVIEHFGNPWGIDINGNLIDDGGVDGEAQILILICEGDPATGGIFYSADEEPAGVDESIGFASNGAEIIYLNRLLFDYTFFSYAVLAHEFQHLCNYNQSYILDGKFNLNYFVPDNYLYLEAVFNEGLSVLSEDLNGFGLKMANNTGNGNIFYEIEVYLSTFSNSNKSFIEWEGDFDDYGKAYLFWKFIHDTYGVDAINSINISHEPPPKCVELATNKKFDELIQEFLIAIMQSDSDTPIQPNIKLNIDRSITYYGDGGEDLGLFSPIKYVDGFLSDKIFQLNPYVLRLFKIRPKDGKVSFVLSNIKEDSNTSINACLINK